MKFNFAKIVTFDNSNHKTANLYTLMQIFMAEKGVHSGLTLASVEDYVRGLPSCLDFPFCDFEILQKTGLMSEKYWPRLAKYVYDLILESNCELVGTVCNIERIDTSAYGNPRYSFTLDTSGEFTLHHGSELVRLQTEVNAALGYSITNYNNKKVIVTTRHIRGKLCATKITAITDKR